MEEFKRFASIVRGNPFNVVITEKYNGTNACIVIEDGEIVGVQSRNRFITVDDDNYGFARWVEENTTALLELGEGRHYGEWVGLGINKNHHCMDKKYFYLFNTHRWNDDNKPDCCEVVRILYEGDLGYSTIPNLLLLMKESAKGDEVPEGVVVYHTLVQRYTKHTIDTPNGKWTKEIRDGVNAME